jgi:hypothetical protein
MPPLDIVDGLEDGIGPRMQPNTEGIAALGTLYLRDIHKLAWANPCQELEVGNLF